MHTRNLYALYHGRKLLSKVHGVSGDYNWHGIYPSKKEFERAFAQAILV